MRKSVAVVICNYNKKDLLMKCIDAVLNSTYKDLDLIVVDNASSDDSVQYLKSSFKNIKLIENKENLGGSGGFNTGIKAAVEMNYNYVVLLDNDAFLKEDAIENLVKFMDNNEDVALAGAKICSADEPEILQEFGADIDFENYNVKPYYKGCKDDDSIPEIKYCDYVPICAAIVRKTAVDEVGMMPWEAFLYWDDIEWGYRFNRAGYKVCVIRESVALHKMGAAEKKSTMVTYYFWRNRINFFARYLNEDKIETFCEHLLKELYRANCACILGKKLNTLQTLQNAFYDSLFNLRGKALEGTVLEADDEDYKLRCFLKNKEKIQIIYSGELKALQRLIKKIRFLRYGCKIHIYCEDSYKNELSGRFDGIELVHKLENNVATVKLVEHVFSMGDFIPGLVYADEFLNMVLNQEDYMFCKNFMSSWDYFYQTIYDFACRKLLAVNARQN